MRTIIITVIIMMHCSALETQVVIIIIMRTIMRVTMVMICSDKSSCESLCQNNVNNHHNDEDGHEDNLMEENMVPSSVGSEHRVQRHEKYFVSAGITGGLSL